MFARLVVWGIDWAPGWLLVGGIPALGWGLALVAFWRARPLIHPPRWMTGWIIIASILLLMSLGGALLPRDLLLSDVVLILIGVDLLLVGYGMAVFDAYDEGESFLPHALQALAWAAFNSIVFGGQVLVVMALEGRSPALDTLLMSSVTASILLTIYGKSLQNRLNMLIFSQRDARRAQQAELRDLADALPRTSASADILHQDDATLPAIRAGP